MHLTRTITPFGLLVLSVASASATALDSNTVGKGKGVVIGGTIAAGGSISIGGGGVAVGGGVGVSGDVAIVGGKFKIGAIAGILIDASAITSLEASINGSLDITLAKICGAAGIQINSEAAIAIKAALIQAAQGVVINACTTKVKLGLGGKLNVGAQIKALIKSDLDLKINGAILGCLGALKVAKGNKLEKIFEENVKIFIEGAVDVCGAIVIGGGGNGGCVGGNCGNGAGGCVGGNCGKGPGGKDKCEGNCPSVTISSVINTPSGTPAAPPTDTPRTPAPNTPGAGVTVAPPSTTPYAPSLPAPTTTRQPGSIVISGAEQSITGPRAGFLGLVFSAVVLFM
ncbi:hypothetical protein HDV05_004817 [Chytridiales sp. JEL 0842]|nr:hypothetical protein HDV05_004817 [Chytridiales sp. JEL 0842]